MTKNFVMVAALREISMTRIANAARRWGWFCALLPACATELPASDYELGADAGVHDDVAQNVAVVEQPLLAGIQFENASNETFPHWMCTKEEKFAAAQVGIVGRTIASTQTMLDCIDHTMRNQWRGVGPYVACTEDGDEMDACHGCSLDARIARVKAVTQHASAVVVTCMEGEAGISEVGSYNGASHVGVNLTNVYGVIADPNKSYAQRLGMLSAKASQLWHEAMHSHRYHHDSGTVSCSSQNIFQSVPEIVEACMRDIGIASEETCPQDMCTATARMPVIKTFSPWTSPRDLPVNAAACACVRDPGASSDPTLDLPSTPEGGVNEADDYFGWSVASGDFDGDHFDDLAVGAPGENAKGMVTIYRGSVLGLYPWRELVPFNYVPIAGDQFGQALAVGDFNDDGLSDLAVGMPQTLTGSGRVFVYLGTSNGRGLVATAMYDQAPPMFANEAGDRFGHALAAGDFDLDGIDDLAVGAPGEVIGSTTKSGYAFLLRGHRTETSGVLTMWAGLRQNAVETDTTGDEFGYSLAVGRIAGVNADRLVVGAPGDGSGRGRVFLFNTRPLVSETSWQPSSSYRPAGLDAGSRFGSSVAIGNFLATGHQGVIAAGAPLHGEGATVRGGAVYVYDHNNSLRQLISRGDNEARMGGALAVAQIDEEGHDDLLVGQVTANASASVQVMAGGLVLWNTSGLSQDVMGSSEAGDSFGCSIATGDFDGDGFTDVAAGAPGEAPGRDPENSGYVFTYRGEGDGSFHALAGIDQEH